MTGDGAACGRDGISGATTPSIRWLALGLCVALSAAGCAGNARTPAPPSSPLPGGQRPTEIVSPPAGPPFEPSPESKPTLDLNAPNSFDQPETPVPGSFPFQGALGYHLRVTLDHVEYVLQVSEHVHFVNETGEQLDSLPLVVEANRRAGVFHLIEVQEVGEARIVDITLEADRLNLSLTPPLAPEKGLDFFIAYTLDLPGAADPLGYSSRQVSFGDWYPFVPAQDAHGEWIMHRPAAVGEHLVYPRADYLVDIQIRDAPENLILAASGAADPVGDGFRCRLAAGRDFAWTVSAEYAVLRGTVGEVGVAIYVFPEHQESGKAALEAVLGAMQVYGESFGPYRRPGFSVVESEFPDGMEYDGLVFVGGEYFRYYGGGPDSYLTAISVHETSHQWWHAAVANDPALEPWLDEALATYSEALYYEHEYPEWLDWWWNFRVQSFEPGGWVDSSIYDHRTFRSYVDAVYLRGALFLRDLRREMGDPAFEIFLRDYLLEGEGRVVSGADFFAGLPEAYFVREPEWMAPYFQRTLNDYLDGIR